MSIRDPDTSTPTVLLPSGRSAPELGLGTWGMGESRSRRKEETAALRLGLDLGMTLIDTAEMYGDGGAEEVVAEAIAGRRESVYVVSKFYPHHASRKDVGRACENSLRRLKTDHLDLYLLHWRGSTPLAETLDALQELQLAGKIADFGVSNFDTDDMEEAYAQPGGRKIAANQVLYNLSRRGIEWDLLPWHRERGIPVMAYSPIEQGRILRNAKLAAVAKEVGVTAAQVALAWLLNQTDLMVIPKAGDLGHVRENHAALGVTLESAELRALDEAFPPPVRKRGLEML